MLKNIMCILLVICLSISMKAQNFDINLLRQMNPINPNNQGWIAATNSAYPITIGVQGGLMAWDYFKSDSSRGMIPLHIGEKLVVVVLTEVMKYAINRKRPYTTYPSLIHPYDASEKALSFPSAHTSFAFNTAATLDIRFHKWYITAPAYLWASLVGYSRLYLGEHYPSDVIIGAALGIGSAYLVDWADHKIDQHKKRKHLLP